MLVSAPTVGLNARFGEKETVMLLKQAGFKAFDISLDAMNNPENDFYTEENYLERAKSLRQYIDEIGMVCNQSHAPFITGFNGDPDSWFYKRIITSIEIAAIMGAKIIVVHPIHHINYAEHAAELFDMNIEFYNRLIPIAQKFGIKIATENMYQRNNGTKIPSDSVCSRAWEFSKLIDTINSPWLVGCLDIGHAALMGADIPKFIKAMGSQRLCALHVHDVDLVNDNHTMPFLQKIDYAPIMQALGEIGYNGDLTFEANAVYRRFPDELVPSVARLMCDTGNYLASLIEKAK